MESRYLYIRKELEDLGYHQSLVPEALSLVEKLVEDLKTTTEGLQKYMRIAQNAIKEKEYLESEVILFKTEKGKLVKECNDLHLTLLNFKEQSEKNQRELKNQISVLTEKNEAHEIENSYLQKQLIELNIEVMNLEDKVLVNPKSRVNSRFKSKPASSTLTKKKSPEKNLKTIYHSDITAAMVLSEDKISNLSKEVKKLKTEQLQLLIKVENRDKEIRRLTDIIDSEPFNTTKRTSQTLADDILTEKPSKDSFNAVSFKSQNKNNSILGNKTSDDNINKLKAQINSLQAEVSITNKDRDVMEQNFKDALSKQHEAMQRAIHLAERNKELEKELRDIDQMALAVEQECNTTVKSKAERLFKLEESLNEALLEVQNLERTNKTLKNEKKTLNEDIQNNHSEKKRLQEILEKTLSEKKTLTDKINNYTIIENDLNMEIDRLLQLSSDQKRRICELECRLVCVCKKRNSLKEGENGANQKGKRASKEVNNTSDFIAARCNIESSKRGKPLHISRFHNLTKPEVYNRRINRLIANPVTFPKKSYRFPSRPKKSQHPDYGNRFDDKNFANRVEHIFRKSLNTSGSMINFGDATNLYQNEKNIGVRSKSDGGIRVFEDLLRDLGQNVYGIGDFGNVQSVYKAEKSECVKCPIKCKNEKLKKLKSKKTKKNKKIKKGKYDKKNKKVKEKKVVEQVAASFLTTVHSSHPSSHTSSHTSFLDGGVFDSDPCCSTSHFLCDSADREILTTGHMEDPACHDACFKQFQELIEKEVDKRSVSGARDALDRIKSEKDFYQREYHRLKQQMEQSRNAGDRKGMCVNCMQNEQTMGLLKQENKLLTQEKSSLINKFGTTRSEEEVTGGGKCNKAVCKRMEREREMLKSDVLRLEEECDCLRDNIKGLSEAKSRDNSRFQQQIIENENIIRKLENERRELLQNQGSRRATINSLEEQADMYREQLRVCQEELNRHRGLYSQLKLLHEQTDRALLDTQAQLVQVETELAAVMQKDTNRQIAGLAGRRAEGSAPSVPICSCREELDRVKRDLTILQMQMKQLDNENLDLLNAVDTKTEKIAEIAEELKSKNSQIFELETAVNGLNKSLGRIQEESASKNDLLNGTDKELNRLRLQLDEVTQSNQIIMDENKRLQEAAALVASDAGNSVAEMQRCRQEVEELKLQSQQYIAEVKKAEDLIAHKEADRDRLLEQFRNLSQDAAALENTNHVLESENSERKVQLTVALDHVSDLERQCSHLETLVKDLEKQISDLTSHIARLESQLMHSEEKLNRAESELRATKDLCVKLDKEKDELRFNLQECASYRMMNEEKLNDLKRERDRIQNQLDKANSTLEGTEKLLTTTRQENMDLRVERDECQREVPRLARRIKDLEEKLFKCICCICDNVKEKCLLGECVYTDRLGGSFHFTGARSSSQAPPETREPSDKRKTDASLNIASLKESLVPLQDALDTPQKEIVDSQNIPRKVSLPTGSRQQEIRGSRQGSVSVDNRPVAVLPSVDKPQNIPRNLSLPTGSLHQGVRGSQNASVSVENGPVAVLPFVDEPQNSPRNLPLPIGSLDQGVRGSRNASVSVEIGPVAVLPSVEEPQNSPRNLSLPTGSLDQGVRGSRNASVTTENGPDAALSSVDELPNESSEEPEMTVGVAAQLLSIPEEKRRSSVRVSVLSKQSQKNGSRDAASQQTMTSFEQIEKNSYKDDAASQQTTSSKQSEKNSSKDAASQHTTTDDLTATSTTYGVSSENVDNLTTVSEEVPQLVEVTEVIVPETRRSLRSESAPPKRSESTQFESTVCCPFPCHCKHHEDDQQE